MLATKRNFSEQSFQCRGSFPRTKPVRTKKFSFANYYQLESEQWTSLKKSTPVAPSRVSQTAPSAAVLTTFSQNEILVRNYTQWAQTKKREHKDQFLTLRNIFVCHSPHPTMRQICIRSLHKRCSSWNETFCKKFFWWLNTEQNFRGG